MKNFAFVFPGQGSQAVGMLDGWGDHPAVAQTLQEASDALGEDVGRLIHEGPKDPNKPPVPGEEKPTTERERMKKVYTYVAILFTVAFLLILWTFLMNQRSINEIKDGNTALQSTLQQNDSLEAHIAELEEQLATAEEDKKALDETVGVQSNQLRALDWLLEIENAYNTGDLDAAKDNIRSFEETGTVEFLPKEPLRTGITGDDAPSPAARYQSIVDKLFPDGVK